MYRTVLHIFLIFAFTGLKAQEVVGSLADRLNKKDITFIRSHSGGTDYCILNQAFFSVNQLDNQLDLSYSQEYRPLRKLQIEKLIGSAHNRQFAALYYFKQGDSKHYYVLKANKFQENWREIAYPLERNKIGHHLFSYQDDDGNTWSFYNRADIKGALFLFNLTADTAKVTQIEGLPFKLLDRWDQLLKKHSQLASASISSNYCHSIAASTAPIKLYKRDGELIVSTDHSYRTTIVRINTDSNLVTVSDFPMQISGGGLSSGSMGNSYLLDKQLYQMVITTQGVTLTKHLLGESPSVDAHFYAHDSLYQKGSRFYNSCQADIPLLKSPSKRMTDGDWQFGFSVLKNGQFEQFRISAILIKNKALVNESLTQLESGQTEKLAGTYVPQRNIVHQTAHADIIADYGAGIYLLYMSRLTADASLMGVNSDGFPEYDQLCPFHLQMVEHLIQNRNPTLFYHSKGLIYAFYSKSRRQILFVNPQKN